MREKYSLMAKKQENAKKIMFLVIAFRAKCINWHVQICHFDLRFCVASKMVVML